jgi:Rv0078B-related antitoxin
MTSETAKTLNAMPSVSSPIAAAFCTTLDLFQTGVDLMRQNLRRRHPDATEHDIEQLLRQWLLERPGAEAGDCQGRPVDVKSRFV